jgi:hypothetical protein
MSHSPRLRINNPSASLDRQECILRATYAVKSRKGRDMVSDADHPLLDCKTAVSEALKQAQEELERPVHCTVRSTMNLVGKLKYESGKSLAAVQTWVREGERDRAVAELQCLAKELQIKLGETEELLLKVLKGTQLQEIGKRQNYGVKSRLHTIIQAE